MRLALQSSSGPSVSSARPARRLDPLETEVIDLFVALSRLIGQPQSIAEIYGLLFMTATPLTLDDIIERLQLSKGSGSQGLKYLRGLGAVRIVYVAGDRRSHYEAVAELRNLTRRFLMEQIVPHLDSGQNRLERIAALAKRLPAADRDRFAPRLKTLQSWGKNGRRFLPLVARFLG